MRTAHAHTLNTYYWYWSYDVMFKEIKGNNKSILMYRRKRCVSFAHAQCAWTMYKMIVLLYIRAYLPIWIADIRKSQPCMYMKCVILRKNAHAHIDIDRHHRSLYKLLIFIKLEYNKPL